MLPPLRPDQMVPCAVCGVPASPFKITGRNLCDPHFHQWLKEREPKKLGAHQAMEEFVDANMTPEMRRKG